MKNTCFYMTILVVFLSGCTHAYNLDTLNSSKNISNVLLTETEKKCMQQKDCDLIETYMNALGQKCEIYKNTQKRILIFCKRTDTKNWESIKVL